jgi:hypothetical protein
VPRPPLRLCLAILLACAPGPGTGPHTPNAPANVNASPGNGKIFVSWDESPGAGSYNVIFATVPDVWSGATKLGGITSTRHVIPGLTNGTTYYVAVTAVADHESAADRIVQAAPCFLPAPSDVVATPGDGQVTIAWSPVPNALQYVVSSFLADCASPPFGQVNGYAGVGSPFAYPGLTNGTTYCFRVLAQGICPWTPPLPPVSIVGSSQIATGDESAAVTATPVAATN